MKFCAAVLLALGLPAAAGAAGIAIAPGDSIVANPANQRGYFDLVIHGVGIRAEAGESLTVDSLRIDLMRGGDDVLSETVSGDQLVRDTSNLIGAPVPAFISGQLLSAEGFGGFFGAPTVPASSTVLAAGQGLVTTGHYFAVGGRIDTVRVTMTAHDPAGKPVRTERLLSVVQHSSPIDYRSPLRGTWLMQAIPGLQSHHRFNPTTEFAMDFFKVDADGLLAKGDMKAAENFYGYGAPVVAAADGVVVRVTDGETQDRAAMMRRPDESPQAAGERIGAYNMRRYAADFPRAAGGNLVVLRHEKDGRVEYSSYGHLRRLIPVKVGERIAQGQLIGHVGDTGDSPAVHLHFQVNAGADPFTSKSLPVRLQGLRSAGGNVELGRFVIAE